MRHHPDDDDGPMMEPEEARRRLLIFVALVALAALCLFEAATGQVSWLASLPPAVP